MVTSTRVMTAVAAVTLSGVMVLATAAPGAKAIEPFSPGSAFRTAIPAGAALDPNSAPMAARISRAGAMNAALVEFGIPIYHADANTPRHTVTCTKDWGTCPFDGASVPIPADAKPHSGSDGAMVVVDSTSRRVYEFWQANRGGDGWSASWGAINPLDGTGWGGASTGSGASRLGGVIQVSEIARGDIPHALALQTDSVCANVFRPPAVRTDGRDTRADCIPEGARVRLDPELDLGGLDLAPAVYAVARAMQVYGGYIVDVGGAPLSVSFELDTSAANGSIGSAYQKAGFRWDYDNMSAVPWDRLQVLA